MRKEERTLGRTILAGLALMVAAAAPSVAAAADDGAVAKAPAAADDGGVAGILAAAEAGNAEAQGKAGALYFAGQGVPRSLDKALALLSSAARAGDASARRALGFACADADDTPILGAEIDRLYEAAARGDAPAALKLAGAFRFGLCVRPDKEWAGYWYRRAAALGAECATSELARLAADEAPREFKDPMIVAGNVQAPIPLFKAPAEYPKKARKEGVQGRVIFQAMVDEKGAVQRVRIMRTLPLLDDAAVSAARRWRFWPAVLCGRPVKVFFTQVIAFKLDQPATAAEPPAPAAP